jgi:hemolysin activation/secretion protein
MAAKIANHYRRNGYFVAQAYLPAQEIKDDAVTIAVIEGRYGNIALRNTSKLSDGLANGLLGGLNRGDPVSIGPLENRLLLLTDLPGVNVRSTMSPGAEVGESDLLVDVTPGRRVSGSVEADNAGNYYTGEYRVGATVNINNLAGQGDVLSFRALTSGPGMTYGRASYQMQLGKATVGVAYAAMDYHLQKDKLEHMGFTDMQSHGTAEIASIYGSYPLIRTRNTNLYGLLAFDHRTYQDKRDLDLVQPVTDKEADVLMAGLQGNNRDNLGGGGLTSYGAIASFGRLNIRTASALDADQGVSNLGQGPHTNGHYQKVGMHLSRLQRATDRISLYGAINGQIASKNLDISEKLGLGGMYGVRAYPVGEDYVDEGYIVNLEARLLLPKFSPNMIGQMHLVGFADTGSGSLNKNTWPPNTGNNHRTLSGAGVGLTWQDYNDFVVNAYWAHKVGNAMATSAPDKNGRFWIQLVKYF